MLDFSQFHGRIHWSGEREDAEGHSLLDVGSNLLAHIAASQGYKGTGFGAGSLLLPNGTRVIGQIIQSSAGPMPFITVEILDEIEIELNQRWVGKWMCFPTADDAQYGWGDPFAGQEPWGTAQSSPLSLTAGASLEAEADAGITNHDSDLISHRLAWRHADSQIVVTWSWWGGTRTNPNEIRIGGKLVHHHNEVAGGNRHIVAACIKQLTVSGAPTWHLVWVEKYNNWGINVRAKEITSAIAEDTTEVTVDSTIWDWEWFDGSSSTIDVDSWTTYGSISADASKVVCNRVYIAYATHYTYYFEAWEATNIPSTRPATPPVYGRIQPALSFSKVAENGSVSYSYTTSGYDGEDCIISQVYHLRSQYKENELRHAWLEVGYTDTRPERYEAEAFWIATLTTKFYVTVDGSSTELHTKEETVFHREGTKIYHPGPPFDSDWSWEDCVVNAKDVITSRPSLDLENDLFPWVEWGDQTIAISGYFQWSVVNNSMYGSGYNYAFQAVWNEHTVPVSGDFGTFVVHQMIATGGCIPNHDLDDENDMTDFIVEVAFNSTLPAFNIMEGTYRNYSEYGWPTYDVKCFLNVMAISDEDAVVCVGAKDSNGTGDWLYKNQLNDTDLAVSWSPPETDGFKLFHAEPSLADPSDSHYAFGLLEKPILETV